MSAYDAPAGTVFRYHDHVFVVLDGHDTDHAWYRRRLAFDLIKGCLTYFSEGSSWDHASQVA